MDKKRRKRKKSIPIKKIFVSIKKTSETNVLNTKKYIVIILSLLFVLFLILMGNILNKKNPTCGDDAPYDACSLTKPYFCSDGILIEKASVCGCPDILTKEGDSCASVYQTNPRSIALNYILRGEEYEIDFVVYDGITNYLSSLSQAIYYDKGEIPSRVDFKLKNIDEENQRELLLPLVKKIQNITNDREDQFRIAVSIVQNIPFGYSEKIINLGRNRTINYSRYPYEVLYDTGGICGEKSELLIFILREIGYGVVFFYHAEENHESLGIKCPVEQSLDNTGYCFIETTGPSIITDSSIEYMGGIRLTSKPEVIPISQGTSLPENLYEYRDADSMAKINKAIRENGKISILQKLKLNKLRKKYGLVDEYNPL